MPIDALTIAATADALRQSVGMRLQRIDAVGRFGVRLELHGGGGQSTWLIDVDPRQPRLAPTTLSRPAGRRPSAATLLLRKWLDGARLESSGHIEGERVLWMEFAGHTAFAETVHLRLLMEWFGPHSDAYLLGPEGTVLFALRGLRFEAQVAYRSPAGVGDLPKALSGLTAARRAELFKNPVPSVAFSADGTQPKDLYPLDIFEGPTVFYTRWQDALQAFSDGRSEALAAQSLRTKFLQALGTRERALRRKLAAQEQEIPPQGASDRLRTCGELLMAYAHDVPPSAADVTLPSFDFTGEETIALDPGKTAIENAQAYFKAFRKAERRLVVLKEELESTRAALSTCEDLLDLVTRASEVEDLEALQDEVTACCGQRGARGPSNGPKTLQPHVYRTRGGFEVLVGRNMRQNDELTFRTARERDLWLHAKGEPGSHVIVRCAGQAVAYEDISDAALIAAFFSRARRSENVEVDVTERRHVKKPSGARPGYVIYYHQRTVVVTPSEEALRRLTP